MDQKTNDLVLQALITASNNQHHVEYPIEKIFEIYPKLEKKFIESSIVDLNNLGLVATQYADNTIYNLCITPKGIGYFRENDALRETSRKKFVWETLKWLLSLVASLASIIYSVFFKKN